MPTNPRVDDYIKSVPPFAKPILTTMRELVHQGCPMVEEDIKWNRPVFLHGGKILCGMSAFKAYCSFFIFRQQISEQVTKQSEEMQAVGQALGRIATISDLPSRRNLSRYIREAVRTLDDHLANPAPRPRKATTKPEAKAPEDLATALARDKEAEKAFQNFSPSHRREYIEWITEAKREETRQKRIATTLEWLREGKSRNRKCVDC